MPLQQYICTLTRQCVVNTHNDTLASLEQFTLTECCREFCHVSVGHKSGGHSQIGRQISGEQDSMKSTQQSQGVSDKVDSLKPTEQQSQSESDEVDFQKPTEQQSQSVSDNMGSQKPTDCVVKEQPQSINNKIMQIYMNQIKKTL